MAEELYKIEFSEVAQLQRGLNLLKSVGGKPKAAASRFTSYMRKQTDQTFVKRGRGEVRWPALAASTVEQKRRKGRRATSILQDTRTLRKSIVHETSGRGDRFVSSQSTNVPYATFHQTGTRLMPARPFAFYTDKDVDQSEAILLEETEKALRKAIARRRV